MSIATQMENLLIAVPAGVVYVIVFLLPFLEAAILLGFIVPGETALVFGGVLAGKGESSLIGVLLVAILGAVTGDAVGYLVGRRYGPALQVTRLGQVVGEARWRTAEEFVRRRGGPAVFLGRYTALLRALVPGVAGMARLHYPTFAIWNLLGGATWATACVVGGWALGDVITRYLSDFGWVVLGLVVLVVAVVGIRHLRTMRDGGHPAP
jgi:membrane-associated protein